MCKLTILQYTLFSITLILVAACKSSFIIIFSASVTVYQLNHPIAHTVRTSSRILMTSSLSQYSRYTLFTVKFYKHFHGFKIRQNVSGNWLRSLLYFIPKKSPNKIFKNLGNTWLSRLWSWCGLSMEDSASCTALLSNATPSGGKSNGSYKCKVQIFVYLKKDS